MMYHFNVTGADRKALVGKISELLSIPAKYKGVPSTAYQIGDYEVSRDGILSWADMDDADPEKLERSIDLLKALETAGFHSDEADFIKAQETALEAAEEQPEDPTGMTITIPLNMVDAGKLTNLLDSKGALIKTALGIPATPIVIAEDTISFPWFEALPTDEELAAYSKFIGALCAMSKNQKRISAAEKPVDNEKYAFRCFLLRLGFIGDAYKKDRKILLRNLNGSSAFRIGTKKEVEAE